MKQHDDTEMLRRYIRESLIVEYDVAGVNFGDTAGYQYSGQLGPGGLKGVEKPIAQALDAFKAVGEKGTAASTRLLKVGLAGFLDMLTGGKLAADYEKIHSEYDNEIKQINSKYRDAIESSWKILGKNAPVAAVMGLPAALTVKAIIDNPKLTGAALALAGAGPATAIAGKINAILGASGAAATATTVATGAALGAKAASALSRESRRRKHGRIILEAQTNLTPEQETELENLVGQLRDLAQKGAEGYKEKIETATENFANKVGEITSQLKSVGNKLTPEQAAAAKGLADTMNKDAAKSQEIFGDEESPLSAAVEDLPSFKPATSDEKPSKEKQGAPSPGKSEPTPKK